MNIFKVDKTLGAIVVASGVASVVFLGLGFAKGMQISDAEAEIESQISTSKELSEAGVVLTEENLKAAKANLDLINKDLSQFKAKLERFNFAPKAGSNNLVKFAIQDMASDLDNRLDDAKIVVSPELKVFSFGPLMAKATNPSADLLEVLNTKISFVDQLVKFAAAAEPKIGTLIDISWPNGDEIIKNGPLKQIPCILKFSGELKAVQELANTINDNDRFLVNMRGIKLLSTAGDEFLSDLKKSTTTSSNNDKKMTPEELELKPNRKVEIGGAVTVELSLDVLQFDFNATDDLDEEAGE